MLSLLKFNREDLAEHRWSVASLVAVNLLPLAGVLFLGWSAFEVVFLYWMENVVIGGLTILKMLTCWPTADGLAEGASSSFGFDEGASEKLSELAREHGGKGQAMMQASKLFIVPFFTAHYGLFCLVHGVFVCVLLSGFMDGTGTNPLQAGLDALSQTGVLLAIGGLTASHLVSYFTNFLGRGEYRRTAPPLLMMAPYPRIIVLHVAIVMSGFLIIALGQPIALLMLLVIGKTLLDLSLHLAEHRLAKEDASPTSPPFGDA